MDDAKKIDQVEVVPGRLIKVVNQNKKSAAKSWYYNVWVEDASGKRERPIMLTQKELERAEERARKNPEDVPQKNRLWDLLT